MLIACIVILGAFSVVGRATTDFRLPALFGGGRSIGGGGSGGGDSLPAASADPAPGPAGDAGAEPRAVPPPFPVASFGQVRGGDRFGDATREVLTGARETARSRAPVTSPDPAADRWRTRNRKGATFANDPTP